jgi:hypothetical protein
MQIRRHTLGAFALLSALSSLTVNAENIKTVFVIAMENHNWTQPANQFTGGIQQIYQNPNAPFINSLVNGTAYAVINGKLVNISQQTSYASAYHNVLATPSGNNPSPHAHANVNGLPYASPVNLTHSSDLRTMQEIFRVGPPLLGDAANATDLSDLFGPGAIPKKP